MVGPLLFAVTSIVREPWRVMVTSVPILKTISSSSTTSDHDAVHVQRWQWSIMTNYHIYLPTRVLSSSVLLSIEHATHNVGVQMIDRPDALLIYVCSYYFHFRSFLTFVFCIDFSFFFFFFFLFSLAHNR
jgi:hypothetical protein